MCKQSGISPPVNTPGGFPANAQALCNETVREHMICIHKEMRIHRDPPGVITRGEMGVCGIRTCPGGGAVGSAKMADPLG